MLVKRRGLFKYVGMSNQMQDLWYSGLIFPQKTMRNLERRE